MNDLLPREEASDEALMGHIVDEYLERRQRGERPDFEEYARRYPHLAGVLRQLLPALGLLQKSDADSLVDVPTSAADLTPEGPLGDFRLVREIGRGGMGVVYEAVQISLGRRVALKVLPFAAALDARQLQRFKNEAHAAAQLQHQNIVPVYGVGCERGVHYYAMQLIDGQTLAAVIADLRRLAHGTPEERSTMPQPQASGLLSGKWLADPGWSEQPPTGPYVSSPQLPPLPESKKDAPCNGHKGPEGAAADTVRQLDTGLSSETSTRHPAFFRSVAQLGIQAARALEHSHSLGVIHRDIKPTNLLLDARGNLWITDFGLAHVHNDTKLTLTGDVLGTLRYMSPEQALAQRVVVDHRTDVYSLGATLYELLTLEPVFTGSDRRELLRQIAFEEPRRPRQLNRAIPVELETIVRKALEKNPAERYGTAKDMADDLERFLEDQPIRARPPSLLLRLRKWARRHRPVVASALAATLTVLAIAIAALAISLANISAALKDKSDALEREKETNYLQRIALAGRELAAGNVGRTEELLDDCPEHLRGWEWHFLKRQRYDTPLSLEHPETVVTVAFSPDGSWIASGCLDGVVRVWDAATGKERHTLPGKTGMEAFVRCLSWTSDGRYLAAAHQSGHVSVWDAATGHVLAQFHDHQKVVWQVAFSPDGRTLASASSDKTVRLRNIGGGQGTPGDRSIRALEHPAEVKGVAFSSDGERVVSACNDGTVKIWDATTGREIGSIHGQVRNPDRAWFSPDARRLAWTCRDAVIKVWDTATGREEFARQPNTQNNKSATFSPDGSRIALAGFDGTVRLLDGSTGREMLTIYAHPNHVAGVAFSPDGHRLASASYDHTVRIWDARPLTSDPLAPHCVTLTEHKEVVCGIAFSPDGRWLASASWDGTAKVWELCGKAIRPRFTLRGHSTNVKAVAFSADQRTIASGGWDNLVKLWDLQSPQGDTLAERLTIPCSQPLFSIRFSPDGRLLAVGQFRGIDVYNAATGEKAYPFKKTLAPVPGLAFSPDGQRLYSAGASDPCLKVWDVAGEKPIPPEIRHYTSANSAVAVSPDGRRLASAGYEPKTATHTVKVWDAQTGKSWRTLRGHRGYVWTVAFSPDGRYLASGSWDSTVKVWDLEADESAEPVTLRGHAGFIRGLAFSPDGKRLASASGYAGHGEVKVWDASLWEQQANGEGR